MEITEHKTGKQRTVHLPAALLWECRLYASLHRGERLIDCDRSTIYRAVHQMSERLGWAHISAHSVRKLYARTYARKYGAEAAQRELGHDSLATTMLYLHDDVGE